jgi:glycosyltransferase 2 family protein
MRFNRDSRNRWLSLAVTGLLFIGLIFCVTLLIKLVPSLDLELRFSGGTVVLLLICYVVSVYFAALMWRQLVNVGTGLSVSWRDTLVGIAALMLGKYLPGKIAGLAGRALTISGKTGMVSAGFISAIEQAYVLAGLVVLSSLSVLALSDEVSSLWVWAAPIVTLIVVIAPSLPKFVTGGYIARWKWASDLQAVTRGIKPLFSFRLLTIAVLIAVGVCAPAWFLSEILSIDLAHQERLILVAAYSMSIMAGMATLILPGGIGVREGSFVLLTQSILTLEGSMAAAALLRLINVAADLLIGMVGLSVWKLRHEPEKPF